MSASDKPLHVGNQAFLDEDYPKAIEAYGAAISAAGEDEVVAKSNRAAAYLKVGKYREALQDASAAAKLQSTEITFYRKGMASFALEEFETALEAFRQGQQLSGPGTGENDPRKYRTWIRKCEAEMEEDEESPLPSDNTPVSKDASNAAESGASPGASQVAKPSASARVPASSAHAHLSIRFQYYQSYEKITVAVLEKGLKKDHVAVEVEARRLTVRRKDDDALLFNKVLYEEVLPEKSRTRFLPSKMEVTLTKKSPADWPELECKPGASVSTTGEERPKVPSAKKAVESKPSAEPPTKLARPYSSTKDWDEVEKDIQRELDAEKPQGEEALNNLFKQIYGKGDEDTRRAMMKSFQTSGGTVLSTNWDEVEKADYEKERQAPKGMEWRTWEGQKLPQKEDDN
ncbi:unnamed protein product [Ascophyllum nodosum]